MTMFFASRIHRPTHISYECVRGDFDVSRFLPSVMGWLKYMLKQGRTGFIINTCSERMFNSTTDKLNAT